MAVVVSLSRQHAGGASALFAFMDINCQRRHSARLGPIGVA